MKPYLYFRVGRRWGKVDLLDLISVLMPELSKSYLKQVYKQKGMDFSIKEE